MRGYIRNVRLHSSLLLMWVLTLVCCVSLPDVQLHDPKGAEVEVLIAPLDESYWDATIGIFDFTCGTNQNDRGLRMAELTERYITRNGLFHKTERLRTYADGGTEQSFTVARSRGCDLVLMGQIVKYEQGSGRSEVEVQVDIVEVATGKTLWRILGRMGSQDLLRREGPNAGKLAEELLPEMLAVLSRVPESTYPEEQMLDPTPSATPDQ